MGNAITKPSRGRTPWSGPPTEVCTHGSIWPDHPAQAASCAAHVCRCQASKGSLDRCARPAWRLSLLVLLPPGMQPRSPALHRTNPWCLAVVCMIGTLTHVHIGQHRAHLCLLALSQVNEVCCLERRARWSRCSSRPWASRSTSARPPQAPRAIVYVLEAVYGRQHGVCATPVPSLALASTRSGPGAAVGRTPALGRLAACVADLCG